MSLQLVYREYMNEGMISVGNEKARRVVKRGLEGWRGAIGDCWCLVVRGNCRGGDS